MHRTEKAEENLRSLIWRHRPETLFRGRLKIVFTENASTLISLNRRGTSSTLRVHRLFCGAPPAILEAIVLNFFTAQDGDEARAIRSRIMDYVDRNRELTLTTTALPEIRSPIGSVYDLRAVYRGVMRDQGPELRTTPTGDGKRPQRRLRVGWSPRATPSLMGKWIETPSGSPNIILVNPLLDDEQVPEFYPEYIVFHEVLHELFPIRRHLGRWVQHPAEFRQRERDFPFYEDARRWEREELGKLNKTLSC